MFVFGLLLGVLDLAFGWGVNWEDNTLLWGILGIPVGLLAVWGLYVFLENRWKKVVVPIKDEISQIGKDVD